jgi:branched-chain amino acid aminotransferase
MAGFEGIKWASKEIRFFLQDKSFEILEIDTPTQAVSRSVHYGIFLIFEGIRFFCKRSEENELEIIFLNWEMNLERFRRGIAFSLSHEQQHLVPTQDELIQIFIHQYLSSPEMRSFIEEMADIEAQGYLRPFTIDEQLSIGVTFPGKPAIRAIACRYDQYLGEPFSGVVVPNIVRAVEVNGTGCIKLGSNYMISLRAIDLAKKVLPEASCALLLDDKICKPLYERNITEWDTSCCLFALADGTIVKIPESNLILPSVTIQGIVAILQEMGVTVIEQNMSYGELVRRVKNNELVTVCSIGTAGILNRCQKLLLVDEKNQVIATHVPIENHPLYLKLREARKYYWDIYNEQVKIPAGMRLDKFIL